MKTGITLPQFGPQGTKENIIRLAKMAEQEHFELYLKVSGNPKYLYALMDEW